MTAPFELPDLPAGTFVAATPRAVLAMMPDVRTVLEGVGYGPESDGERTTADVAGRRPLQEFRSGERRFLVRRFQHGGLLRFATGERFQDPTRPFHELAASHRLHDAGVPTAIVVAARAQRHTGPGWQLEVVTERMPGVQDLARILDRRRTGADRGDWTDAAWRRLIRASAQTITRLHAAGFDHADLQPANLLVDEGAFLAGDAAEIQVIDLDRGSFPPAFGADHRLASLARFARWIDLREARRGLAVNATDRARFLVALEPDRAARHELARELMRRAAATRSRHGFGHMLERMLGMRRSR
tara:strand:- start:34718 stop:35620 length:903 start_codon:yes stop_codon:yes gene_type:complete